MLTANQPSSASAASMRVLLVEDDKGDAHLVHEYLHDTALSHLELFEARALSETCETLRSQAIDAVLLDLQLPDSTGLDTISRVQECDPDLAIIVLTGDLNPDLAERAIARGAQEYILKRHLGPELLSRALRQAVGRSRIRKGFRSLLEVSPAGVMVVDAQQRVRYANRAAQSMFEGSSEELVDAHLPRQLADALTEQVQLQRPGQEPRWLEVKSRSIDWYGEAAELLVISEITERRRVRDLQHRLAHANRLATAGQLAASVAHEVNNPATYVIGNIAELKESLNELRANLQRASQQLVNDELHSLEDLFPGELNQMLELCEESAGGMERIVQVVRELRDFSSARVGRVEPVDVNLALRSACRMVERLIRARALLSVELCAVPCITGCRTKLEQVFTNLLINAAQAVDEGGRDSNWVRVSSRFAGREVIVRVEDSGCGMTPEVKRSVLEPFFTTKPRGVGTGLGLSVSHQIVREHGGRLEIDTRVGHGTVFELAFPLPGPRPVAVSDHGASAKQRTAEQRRLLVIDADPVVRAGTLRLARAQHEVFGVSCWEEARQLLDRGYDFAAILCDVSSPGYDGQGIYQTLLKHYPRFAARLVLCKGRICPANVEEFIHSTSNPCLEKPFTESELQECLQGIQAEKPPA